MSLTLALPYDDSKNKREPTPNRNRSEPKAPRMRFMVEKLKNVSKWDEFQAGTKVSGNSAIGSPTKRPAQPSSRHDSGGSGTCSLVVDMHWGST